jgi:hypothetical protein
MLRQLFISGAVAACELGMLCIQSQDDARDGLVLPMGVINICKQGVSPESSQLNQVIL